MWNSFKCWGEFQNMFYYLLHLKAMHFQKWETLLSHHDRKVVPVNPAVSKCEDLFWGLKWKVDWISSYSFVFCLYSILDDNQNVSINLHLYTVFLFSDPIFALTWSKNNWRYFESIFHECIEKHGKCAVLYSVYIYTYTHIHP